MHFRAIFVHFTAFYLLHEFGFAADLGGHFIGRVAPPLTKNGGTLVPPFRYLDFRYFRGVVPVRSQNTRRK